MKRFIATGVLILGVIGGFWYATQDEDARSVSNLLKSFTANRDGRPEVHSASFFGSELFGSTSLSSQPGNSDTFRVASMRLDLNEQRASDAKTIASLARVMSHFDVIAIQALKTGNPRRDLNNLIDLMNHRGRNYAFSLGPDPGADSQQAFVYDQQKIILDTQHVYTVADPDNLFERDPLVGWFMTRGPDEKRAFTFTLVNVQIESSQREQEITMLGQLYRAVRDDGRGEDDVVLLGDFQADDLDLKYLHRQSRLSLVVREQTTDTEGMLQSQNIIYYPAASVEQTGRGGVFDFLKEFNLTIREAVSISPNLPVWTEFRMMESAG